MCREITRKHTNRQAMKTQMLMGGEGREGKQ